MYLAIAVVCTAILLLYTFYIRRSDLPVLASEPADTHLQGRKAAIYENLRDLQFEYRVGKLSEQDYARTKLELQAELATVLEEIDRLKASPGGVEKPTAVSSPAAQKDEATICPHCSARFDRPLKFCGECGKPMGATA